VKVKDIAAMCKRGKTATVHVRSEAHGNDVEQFIGTDSAIYAIGGMPRITRDMVFTMFDIPEKEQEDFDFREYGLNTVVNAPGIEYDAEAEPVHLVYRSKEYIAYQTQDNTVMFIDAELFKPLLNETNLTEFARKNADGLWVLVVRMGMYIRAVLYPSQWYLLDDALGSLCTIANMTSYTLTNTQQAESAEELDQEALPGFECKEAADDQ